MSLSNHKVDITVNVLYELGETYIYGKVHRVSVLFRDKCSTLGEFIFADVYVVYLTNLSECVINLLFLKIYLHSFAVFTVFA